LERKQNQFENKAKSIWNETASYGGMDELNDKKGIILSYN